MPKERKSSVFPRTNSSRNSSVPPRFSESNHTDTKNTLGTSFTEKRIAFTRQDRQNHTHIIGSTGTGKSKIMELMMRQDLLDRKAGYCLLDPHGSLYEEMVLYASHKYPSLAERFVLFHPAGNSDHILGFNPIPGNAANNIDYILDMLISGCLKAWGQDNTDRTPRITKWLENIFYTIIANELTLVETAPLLSIGKRFQPHRSTLLAKVNNDVVLDDWYMFESSTNTQKQMLIEGAANRLRKFLRNEAVRNVIGQQTHTLDLQRIMDEGKILLVNLNGGEHISHENTKLLGIMLVNEFFRVAKLRDPRDPFLKPFYLYVDEFANFITRDIARALEECRKFKLFLTLAHQHLAQLEEEDEYLYASVLTNCKNRVVFGGLSKEDAQIMTDEIGTGFLNLKSTKDEIHTTKVRHREESRVVRGTSKGENIGENQSCTTGTSETAGFTTGRGRSRTNSATTTTGGSDSSGTTETSGTTRTKGTTKGYSDASGTTEGENWGTSESITNGHSHGESSGVAQGVSQSETNGWSNCKGRSHSTNHSESAGTTSVQSNGSGQSTGNHQSPDQRLSFSSGKSQFQSGSHGDNHSSTTGSSEVESSGHTDSHSHTHGTSRSTTRNTSDTSSQSRTTGNSRAHSRSKSRTHTDNFSESESRAESTQNSTSQSQTKNWSEATGGSTGTTESESTSKSHTESQSTTKGTSRSQSTGESKSTVPFLKPVEYQELSNRTFWTKDELHYLEMAKIKNQDTGVAYIKIGTEAPAQINVDRVTPVRYHPRLSPIRIEQFHQKVFAANSEYYLPVAEARREYQKRQQAVFGEPLRFDEKIVTSNADPEPEVEPEQDNPFND